jgi:hypothetical protein
VSGRFSFHFALRAWSQRTIIKDRTNTARSVAMVTDAPSRPGTVEIESGGVGVRFTGPVDATTLRLVMMHIGRQA